MSLTPKWDHFATCVHFNWIQSGTGALSMLSSSPDLSFDPTMEKHNHASEEELDAAAKDPNPRYFTFE